MPYKGTKTMIGIDPGMTTGVCVLRWHTRRREYEVVWATQWDRATAQRVLTGRSVPPEVREVDALAVERFIVGPRAARSATGSGGAAAREVHDLAVNFYAGTWAVHRATASAAKAWATRARLNAAGIRLPNQRHATDAARHALYQMVRAGWSPDPLTIGALSCR